MPVQWVYTMVTCQWVLHYKRICILLRGSAPLCEGQPKLCVLVSELKLALKAANMEIQVTHSIAYVIEYNCYDSVDI